MGLAEVDVMYLPDLVLVLVLFLERANDLGRLARALDDAYVHALMVGQSSSSAISKLPVT
jgi:hypothetical protein